jgi:hypothetical protein
MQVSLPSTFQSHQIFVDLKVKSNEDRNQIGSEGVLHLSKAQWSTLESLGLYKRIFTSGKMKLELREFVGW